MRVHYRTEMKECPYCHSPLFPYATRHRSVISAEYGKFEAVEHVMGCIEHGIFRSDSLSAIVSPHCRYANDVMTESAVKRFIDGRSCSEIASEFGTGISERHVRNLSNMALDIFRDIHNSASARLREAVGSYVLQIDGTVDSEFSVIIAVRDAVSKFTLFTGKYRTESHESMRSVIQTVKEKFGVPSGITSDMRSAIISAAMEVFPGIPIRVCLLHFLRDLGKELMEDVHKDLGMMVNGIGIKSSLRAMLDTIPKYDSKTLYEIEYRFCTDSEKMEMMAVRRILENLLGTTGSSGYGFPFSLKHLNFFIALRETEMKLSDVSRKFTGEQSSYLASQIMGEIRKIAGNPEVNEKASRLSEINSLIFQMLRNAFNIPDSGSLSDEMPDDVTVHEKCNTVIGEMDVYLHSNIPQHIFKAAKKAVERYREREHLLFANNEDGTIPRTNNNMETLFRRVRRNVRKRCGSIATGNILKQSGDSLVLFQNMDNKKYLEVVFGADYIPSVFGKHRKRFKREGLSRSRTLKLVDEGIKMMLTDSLYDSPYNDYSMEKAYASRNGTTTK